MSDAVMAYPWQMPQWQQVCQLLEEQRLPHALLFSGPADTGKKRFADAMLAGLLCEQPRQHLCCGECKSCNLRSQGSHPDLKVICPHEGKRQIGVDQVRVLQQFTGQSAFREGGKKLVLVYPAEAMNAFTANALLKTLEEPAGDTVIVLLSHAPSQLLPTIRSRCLQMNFGIPPEAAALSWLKNYVGDDAQARVVLAEAGGRPLAARAMFENDSLNESLQFDQGLSAVAAGSKSVLQLAEEWQGGEPLTLLEWWLRRLVALIRHHNTGEPVAEGWQAFLGIPPVAVFEHYDEALQLRAKIQRGANLNKRLMVEKLLLEWFALRR
ncbi:DNA polymerase III subunit delta' [Spongiibacter sp. KMU-166]|uniref:DNA polymerase III subunit delta' n=1 Tax=Spongiibacter thalassae TaxID=2721624 RepID=A0ABX1GEI0_9GAMM|nr:DNA polymerase III subunit delta' [Spongiibacter thalassae]NKI17326.1 DNA polymerase III subunit delta' [Spongiibacter thalassae]